MSRIATLVPTVPLVLLCALATPLFAQRTWIVDAARGPGTDFTTLIEAASRVPTGDTVVVRKGTYRATTFRRAVRLLGEPGAVVDVISGHGGGGLPLTVRDLPAGQTVVVRGLTASSDDVRVAVMWIKDCKGTVLIEGVACRNSRLGGAHTLSIEGSAAVLVRDTFLEQGVEVERSHAVISACRIQRTAATVSYANPFPSVVVDGGSAWLADVTVVGEGPGFYRPEPALAARNGSRVRLVAGAGSSFTAGSKAGYPRPALQGDASSSLELDPAVRLVSTGSAPPHQGFGRVVTTGTWSSVTAQGGDLGGRIDVRVRGPQGVLHVTVAGSVAPPQPLPGAGSLWLDPATLVLVRSGVFGASGVDAFGVPVPNLPALRGFAVGWQALTRASSGRFELANPVSVTVR